MFDQFRDKFRLDDEKWNRYTNYFNKVKVPVKTILLNEGEVSKKLFLHRKGCIRVCFNHDGKDITSQFFLKKIS